MWSATQTKRRTLTCTVGTVNDRASPNIRCALPSLKTVSLIFWLSTLSLSLSLVTKISATKSSFFVYICPSQVLSSPESNRPILLSLPWRPVFLPLEPTPSRPASVCSLSTTIWPGFESLRRCSRSVLMKVNFCKSLIWVNIWLKGLIWYGTLHWVFIKSLKKKSKLSQSSF